MGSAWFQRYKPALAMVAVQFIYAVLALSAKAAFAQGMSPMVFVVYRQAMATIFMLPLTTLARGCSLRQMGLGLKGFCLVFFAALVGVTANQYFYYGGVSLANPTVATATTNLIPAITFVMAATIGIEKVKLGRIRSMAKVLGTVICVGGAFIIAFATGPALLSSGHQKLMASVSISVSKQWMIGCFLLMGSTCFWSLWLILQVPICKRYLDPMSLTVWMCLLGTIQSAIVTVIVEPDFNAWKITTGFQWFCCLFAGIFGSGVTFFLQSWSVSIRGPLFSAMFNPLNTVIATIVAIPLLHEKLYVGSLIGAVAVVGGLYIVLWGKADDFDGSLPVSGDENADGDNLNESFFGENQMIRRGSSYSLI